ncbi:hypothetical protein SBDP1_310022 [Syntrophobacter sp. SbD1]|nr:hypothetical protein SBDP1_310022 [Syntrophobacter sp. SbD1]
MVVKSIYINMAIHECKQINTKRTALKTMKPGSSFRPNVFNSIYRIAQALRCNIF